MLPKIENSRTG